MTGEMKARILGLIQASKAASLRGDPAEALRLLTSAIYLMGD